MIRQGLSVAFWHRVHWLALGPAPRLSETNRMQVSRRSGRGDASALVCRFRNSTWPPEPEWEMPDDMHPYPGFASAVGMWLLDRLAGDRPRRADQ